MSWSPQSSWRVGARGGPDTHTQAGQSLPEERGLWGSGEVSELSKVGHRTSLVEQWISICLPLQGTQVPFLVREDSTRRGAAEPQLLSPSPGACELQLLKPECPGACALQQERPPQQEAHTQLERSLHKATAQNEDYWQGTRLLKIYYNTPLSRTESRLKEGPSLSDCLGWSRKLFLLNVSVKASAKKKRANRAIRQEKGNLLEGNGRVTGP